MNIFGKYWELAKYEIRNLAISVGKVIAFDKRQKECRITKINKNMELSCKGNLTPQVYKFRVYS